MFGRRKSLFQRWRDTQFRGDIIKLSTRKSFAKTFGEYGFRSESFVPSYGMAEACSVRATAGFIVCGAATEN